MHTLDASLCVQLMNTLSNHAPSEEDGVLEDLAPTSSDLLQWLAAAESVRLRTNMWMRLRRPDYYSFSTSHATLVLGSLAAWRVN